jgi:hypothetical protein
VNDDIDEAGEQERSCITIEGQNEKAAFQEGRSENDPLVKTTVPGRETIRCFARISKCQGSSTSGVGRYFPRSSSIRTFQSFHIDGLVVCSFSSQPRGFSLAKSRTSSRHPPTFTFQSQNYPPSLPPSYSRASRLPTAQVHHYSHFFTLFISLSDVAVSLVGRSFRPCACSGSHGIHLRALPSRIAASISSILNLFHQKKTTHDAPPSPSFRLQSFQSFPFQRSTAKHDRLCNNACSSGTCSANFNANANGDIYDGNHYPAGTKHGNHKDCYHCYCAYLPCKSLPLSI